MKKTALLPLIIILSMMFLAFPANAELGEEETPMKISWYELPQEVSAVVEKSYDLYEVISKDTSEYIDLEADPIFLDRNGVLTEYYPGKGEFSSVSYWKERAEEIYPEELVPFALDYSRGGVINGLMREHNGKVYFMENPMPYGNYGDNYNWSKGGFGYLEAYKTKDKYTVNLNIRVCPNNYGQVGGLYSLYGGTLEISRDGENSDWSISGGSLLQFVCPALYEDAEMFRTNSKTEKFLYNDHVLYRQEAKYVAESYLSETLGKQISANVYVDNNEAIYFVPKSVNCFDYFGEQVEADKVYYFSRILVNSPQINGGKWFCLRVSYSEEEGKWLPLLNASIRDTQYDIREDSTFYDYRKDFVFDDAILYELAALSNAETADCNGDILLLVIGAAVAISVLVILSGRKRNC